MFFVHFENNCLLNCPSHFNPHYYQRCFDDIFVLFTSPGHSEAFWHFLNGRHANMLFTIENENQNSMAFLDVQIIQEDKVFTTSVYQKPTFSGIYTHPFTMHLKAWYCLHTKLLMLPNMLNLHYLHCITHWIIFSTLNFLKKWLPR